MMSTGRYFALSLAIATIITGAGIMRHEPSEASSVSSQDSITPVPEGAIQVSDDLYQVPIGKDADGCQRYRMFSRTKAVVQAIFYRDSNGEFTMDKSKAVCDGK